MFGLGVNLFRFFGADTYGVLGDNPKLVADFDDSYYRANGTQTDFSSLINFARASTATYVDANGVLQTATSGEPRLNHHVYNGSTWVNEGILIESEARTNLVTYSEDFTNPVWAKSGVTVTSNAIIAPDGNTTADKIEKTTTDTTTPAIVSISATAGQVAVWSVFVKDDSSSGWVRLRSDNSGSVVSVWVNYKTGVVGTGGLVAGVQDYGNGWKRIYAVRTIQNTGGVDFSFCPVIDESSSGLGQSLYFWGAQVEIGSLSSYIPTSGSTVTRSAEILTIPAANLPYSSTSISIQMDGRIDYYDRSSTSTDAVYYRWYKDNSNTIITEGRGSYVIFIQAESGTVDFALNVNYGYDYGLRVPYSIASRHGSMFINGAISGTALTANTTPTALPDLSSNDFNLAHTYMGTIKTFRMWDVDLGDAGIESASS